MTPPLRAPLIDAQWPVSKGLSTEAGVFDTTSAGSSPAVITFAGIYLISCFSAPSAMISAVFMSLSSSGAAVLAFHHGFEVSELWDFEKNTKLRI